MMLVFAFLVICDVIVNVLVVLKEHDTTPEFNGIKGKRSLWLSALSKKKTNVVVVLVVFLTDGIDLEKSGGDIAGVVG
jgi:hypothetical protein